MKKRLLGLFCGLAGLTIASAAFAGNSGQAAGQAGQAGQAGSVPTPVMTMSPSPTPTTSASPSTTPTPNQVTVMIQPGSVGQGPAAFGTNPLVIPRGTTVVWINNDTLPHTATSDTGVFDSGNLNTGQQFTFTFNDSGTFPYHCQIHGAQSMSGVIQVQ